MLYLRPSRSRSDETVNLVRVFADKKLDEAPVKYVSSMIYSCQFQCESGRRESTSVA